MWWLQNTHLYKIIAIYKNMNCSVSMLVYLFTCCIFRRWCAFCLISSVNLQFTAVGLSKTDYKAVFYCYCHYTPAQRSWRGVYWIHLVRPSVRLSVCRSVCRRHGFRSISQVCFGISISNFICILMVAIGKSLLIFSEVIFKMAACWLYWIFWFPDSNLTLTLNINFKLQQHNTYVNG